MRGSRPQIRWQKKNSRNANNCCEPSGVIIRSVRQIIRREKWRLRPLKQLVLPFRNLKRRIITLDRVVRRKPPPRIEKSTVHYLAVQARGAAIEIYPAEPVQSLPHPFGEKEDSAGFSEPARMFELQNIDFWARYGGSVVTSDNRLLADLSPEVWGIENHPIFSTFRLPKSRRLSSVVHRPAPATAPRCTSAPTRQLLRRAGRGQPTCLKGEPTRTAPHPPSRRSSSRSCPGRASTRPARPSSDWRA